MKKTRKECREETGYEPEEISRIARKNSRWNKEQKNWTHDQKVVFVYEGLKFQRQQMLKKKGLKSNTVKTSNSEVTVSASNHNCTGSSACFGCERERRDAYKDGGHYYA